MISLVHTKSGSLVFISHSYAPQEKMFVIVTFLLIVVTVGIFNHLKLMRKFRWLKQFPGPSPTFPVVGNALEFLTHHSDFGEICHTNFKKFGSVWKLWLLDEPTLFTADPKLLKELLGSQNHLGKHFFYQYGTKIFFGDYGLITSETKQWKADRKLFNQSFKFEYLEMSFKQCVNQMSYWPRLLAHLKAKKGEAIDFLPRMRTFFLDVLLKSMNVDPSVITEGMLSDMGDSFDRGLELARLLNMKPWTRNPVYWKLFGYQRQLRNLHERVGVHIAKILGGMKCQSDIVKAEDGEIKTKDERTKKTISDLLGDADKPTQWKYDHLFTILAAGTDTTAVTTTMTLFFLALNPECQKKVQDEVDLLFEERTSGELTYSDMSKMKYLRMCIKETMRLHPPAPLLGRTTSQDILMEDGRTIPKGAAVFVIIPQLHMDPKIFPNPKKFDPDRFDESNSSSIKPYTYIPFSAGPRNCIGQKFGDCVLTRVIVEILRNFSIKTHQKAEDIKILYEIAGTPYPNVELAFENRL